MPEVSGREAAFTDADFPAEPYPGARPDCSFVHTGGVGYALHADAGAPSGWRVAGQDLDDWLRAHDSPVLAERLPVLAYGSNACPAKVTWLRTELGLPGPAVVLLADVDGLAAVWAAGLRARDGQRPATIMAAPGVRERHAVWLADPAQLRVLDACEGRGVRYRLAQIHSGLVSVPYPATARTPASTATRALPGVLGYAGLSPQRMPLYVAGAAVRCADVAQEAARALAGVPGPDRLVASTVLGPPGRWGW